LRAYSLSGSIGNTAQVITARLMIGTDAWMLIINEEPW
jgi:hypothetical protein